MLVISRKAGERICIGDDVTITVLETVGSNVRIGIEAPSHVPVYRYEIWLAIQEENKAAAESKPEDIPTRAKLQQD